MPKRVIVVGGGLAGLSATIAIAEKGVPVDLFSMVPVKRSHSVCAQGGINAAKNMKGEGDHPDIHVTDTLFGGEYLANQPIVKGMCYQAPKIIDLLDRMGVPFNRTPEGNLDFRRFGGTLHHRTAYSGATTGQQLLYALDEQVRRFETQGLVEKYEHWEFLSLVLDDDKQCRGISATNIWDRSIHTFKGGAVILCTGGPGLVFGKSTNSIINTGAAAARAWQQGVWYGNGEFIQVHPTSIPGADKLRLISESVRGEGGRVWVPKNTKDERPPNEIPDSDRDYFLETKYPKYGNLVPRDIATREIFHVCVSEGRGIDSRNQVYLDITPEKSGQDGDSLEKKLGGVFEIYRKFVGVDPLQAPMRIFPGMHYSMGGIYVSSKDDGDEVMQMTNIPGCFAAGEVEYQYHGANRLGANSLLSCIYGGGESGKRAVAWAESHSADPSPAIFDAELRRQEEISKELSSRSGTENVFQLHKELGEVMTAKCTVVRENAGLDEAISEIFKIEERFKNIDMNDSAHTVNHTYLFARAFGDMVNLAKAIAKGARQRDECRGAHYKPEFDIAKPEKEKLGDPVEHDGYRKYCAAITKKWGARELPAKRGDELSPEFVKYMDLWVKNQEKWNKSTIADFNGGDPKIEYRDVDMSVEPPKPRIYK